MEAKKTILIGILFVILLVTPTTSKEKYNYFIKGDIYSFNPRIQEWYTVEDWELEVCRVWGGTEEPSNSADGPDYLSQTTITLQGEKTDYPDETTLYEVAWYIEDATNRSIDYAVRLTNKEESKYYRIKGKTTVSKNQADSGYKAEYLSERYDKVQLRYALEGENKAKMVTRPIVDNKGEYVPSSDYGSAGDEDLNWDDW